MPQRRPSRWVSVVAWLYATATVAVWACLVLTSERWLPATLLAYGPRWPVALPLTLLVPLALLRAPRALVPLAVASAVVLWPVMGFRASMATFGRSMPPTPLPGTLRVLTYNTFGGSLVADRLDDVMSLHPDVITLQECGERLFAALARVPTLHVMRYRSLCTASRWPIVAQDSLPRSDPTMSSAAGNRGAALAMRYEIATPYGPLRIVNVHLETARYGLQGFTPGDGLVPDNLQQLRRATAAVVEPNPSATEALAINTEIRANESRRASAWARTGSGGSSAPTIVAGDFNLPVESTIFRTQWSAFTDAFESKGTGFGFSKHEGALLHIRIDHVLTNATGPQPRGVWIGPDFGSDHRPVIADMAWPAR